MQVQLIGGRSADFEDMDMDQHHANNHVGFSQRRNASLQRSQDSGALTDWSGGSRGSPTRQSLHSLERDEQHKYVTVLTVNGGLDLQALQVQPKIDNNVPSVHHCDLDDFVTVLSVGAQQKNFDDDNEENGPSSIGVGSVCLSLAGFVEEVACVTRRPGQKLGFGLKFDGGNECDLPIQRLFIQSCAEGSPASKVHCSWGRLVEADEIVEIGGVNIRNTLNRLQVVEMLKDSQQDVLSLKIRHYWDDGKRADIMEHLNSFPPPVVHHPPVIESKPPVTRKVSLRQQQQERAVDVPEELLIQSVMRLGQRKDGWNKGHPFTADESPPPVPPRRKRRTKLMHKGSTTGTGSVSKTVICRSLSSDEVLINGTRVAASSAVAIANTPSKPPRNHRPQHSRSFNATHHNHKDDIQIREDTPIVVQAPATLPRTKEFIGQQPEPKERNRRSILTVNAEDWGIPQPAEVYINLIAEEDKRLMMSIEAASSSSSATESESESNSSVSTVVDNWSVLSSSSGGDPFGDFSEHEEFREFYHTPSQDRGNKLTTMSVNDPQVLPDVVTPESTLSVLIEPPETFLDPGPTSISPTLSNEDNNLHQDASSDSGASSGGSELHLGESDEELRAFQQMESALEMEKLEHECHAISVSPAVEFFNHNNNRNNNNNVQVSGVIERSESRTQQQPTIDNSNTNAICVPDTQCQQQQQPQQPVEDDEPSVECQPEEPVKSSNNRRLENGVAGKKPSESQKIENANNLKNGSGNNNTKGGGGSRSNLNRTPLRSRIPQAVSTPPTPTTRLSTATTPVVIGGRNLRPLANNNRTTTTSNIVAPKVVSSKTSSSSSSVASLRHHNNHNNSQSTGSSSSNSSRMLLAARTTPNINNQRLASAAATTATSSTNLLKSVKPGLPVSTSQATASPSSAIQGSKIPRPSSLSISSGGQPKSSPSAASARLNTHATSSSWSGLSSAHRHPSSPSLLLQASNNRTTTTTAAGVKSFSSSLHKSTSRLHLTHQNNKEGGRYLTERPAAAEAMAATCKNYVTSYTPPMTATTATGTSPPTSRLPPDGHEFPGDYIDDTSTTTSATATSKVTVASSVARGRSGSAGGTGSGIWRTSHTHGGRDERSERSVKDKIALFTHDVHPSPPSSSAAGSTVMTSSSANSVRNLPVSVAGKTKHPTLSCSVDNLSVGRSPMVSPVIRSSDSRTLPRHQLAVTPAVKAHNAIHNVERDGPANVNLSERSRSLLDVAHYSPPSGHHIGQQRHSVSPSPSVLAEIQPRKSSSSLVGSDDGKRKLSLSSTKLRGLVIPDVVDGTQMGSVSPSRAVMDLPEIISKDSVMVVGLSPFAPLRSPNSLHHGGQDVTDNSAPMQNKQKTTSLSSLPWKSNSPSLPKYSPAFKRKELTVLRTPYSHSDHSTLSPTAGSPVNKPPLMTSFSCPSDVDGSQSPMVESETTTNDNSDTDGDSAVSSSRSSFSPSGSPLPERNHQPSNQVTDENTTAALATAASRVLKAQSVEALNRKNVLQSARYSSGGGGSGNNLDLIPPSPPPSVPPPAVPAVPEVIVKLTADVNHQQQQSPTSSLSSPALQRPLIQRASSSKLSAGENFEQTLRKFTTAEASSRIERSSPRLRLSSSERLEIKTALITDVCSDHHSPTVQKISSTSPFHRDGSSPLSGKKLTGISSSNDHHSNGSASKEIKSFRALAERWEAIANETPSSTGSSPPGPNISCIKKASETSTVIQPSIRDPPSDGRDVSRSVTTSRTTTTTSSTSSSSAASSSVESRENKPTTSARPVTSRSVSAGVVEIRKAFERVKEELMETESNCNYGGGQDLGVLGVVSGGISLEDYKQHNSNNLFSLQSSGNNNNNSPSPSGGHHHYHHQHVRMSSLDSTTSEDSSLPYGLYGGCYGGFGSSFGGGYGGGGYGGFYGGPFGPFGVRDNYGSITSLASSTSLISPQELQQLLDEANQSLEESGTPSHEIVVVVLHRGDVASTLSPGLGITLAGGADYETKEITIHKVIGGSVADRDGRIQKGDRVLSINGKGLKGVTHREALAILKAPRPEVVLVLSRNRSVSPQDICHDVDKDLPSVMIPALNTGLLGNPRTSHLLLSSGSGNGISRPPRILESPSDFTNYDHASNDEDLGRGPPVQATLVKEGAGLGFSLEGGKDSPLGDRPLTIKKIFTGGAASKNSTLRVGDQIISVNDCDVRSMSRIEAWNLMKKLPDGAVSLIIRQQITSS